MLEELLKELQKIKLELDQLDPSSNIDQQKVDRLNKIAEQVLNTLDNAELEIPEEYQNDGREQV